MLLPRRMRSYKIHSFCSCYICSTPNFNSRKVMNVPRTPNVCFLTVILKLTKKIIWNRIMSRNDLETFFTFFSILFWRYMLTREPTLDLKRVNTIDPRSIALVANSSNIFFRSRWRPLSTIYLEHYVEMFFDCARERAAF